MGGDDLGSDDDYWTAPVQANDSSDDDEAKQLPTTRNDSNDNKNKRQSTTAAESTTTTKEEEEGEPPRPSKKRRKGGTELRRLGHDIRNQSTEVQARLLTQFIGADPHDTSSPRIFRPHQVGTSSSSDANNNNNNNKNKSAADDERVDEPLFQKRLQGIISKKRLKKFNTKGGSPCVAIICLSARRAVQLLKELAPFSIRAVKLFAKHMEMKDQIEQLENHSFGFAVGTPHRMLQLAQQGALSFEHTQLVVLDTFVNPKQFAVYTLPDTLPHTQELLKDFVLPECQKRRDVRVAFV
jgi:hypothetical protein